MRTLTAAIIGLAISSTALAQDPSVVVNDIFEHKVIITAGPLKPSATGHDGVGKTYSWDIPAELERKIENLAAYACSTFGRYAYPMNVRPKGCGKYSLGCTKNYMYVCGTHKVD